MYGVMQDYKMNIFYEDDMHNLSSLRLLGKFFNIYLKKYFIIRNFLT